MHQYKSALIFVEQEEGEKQKKKFIPMQTVGLIRR